MRGGPHVVIVRWLPIEEGGRQKPPRGPTYSTVAKFVDATANWSTNAWSVVLEYAESTNQPMECRASIRFLSDDAPEHLLTVGSHLDLYEGAKLVARAEVVG
jgi:hypothetical protein